MYAGGDSREALISSAPGYSKPLTYLALSTVRGLLVDSTANKAHIIQKR